MMMMMMMNMEISFCIDNDDDDLKIFYSYQYTSFSYLKWKLNTHTRTHRKFSSYWRCKIIIIHNQRKKKIPQMESINHFENFKEKFSTSFDWQSSKH